VTKPVTKHWFQKHVNAMSLSFCPFYEINIRNSNATRPIGSNRLIESWCGCVQAGGDRRSGGRHRCEGICEHQSWCWIEEGLGTGVVVIALRAACAAQVASHFSSARAHLHSPLLLGGTDSAFCVAVYAPGIV
jgi:hypothetical protein